MRTEEEVDRMIEEMINRTKGKYITQGCSFNKTCPRQMGLLKQALMSSISFSGLAKEMLALKFDNGESGIKTNHKFHSTSKDKPINKNVGNFV